MDCSARAAVDARIRPSRILETLLGVACAALAACSQPASDDVRPLAFDAPTTPPLVVWLVVDTLRADALGAYGAAALEDGARATPALDALAVDGAVFESCYATAPWTVPSLASQLTGRWPFEHGATRLLEPLPESFVTLPEVLASAGWRTLGVGTNFVATGRLGFSQGFQSWDDSLAQGHDGSTAPAAVERMLAALDAGPRPSTDAPTLLFGLWFEPHFRYVRHAVRPLDVDYAGPLTGAEELAELRAKLRSGELDDADLAHLRTLYAGEVAAVDRAFAQLKVGLEERGLWDDTLVVVTADHGEELGERGWIGHTVSLSEDLMRVPLIVRAPEGWGAPRARRVQTPVSQVDLAETLLDWCGVPDARRAEHLATGGSFAGLLFDDAPAPRRFLYLHTRFEPLLERSAPKRAHRMGVIDADTRAKWVVDHDRPAGERPRGALHLLDVDPGALEDRADGGRLPDAYAYLARLRGLTTDGLGERDAGEVVPVPAAPEGDG